MRKLYPLHQLDKMLLDGVVPLPNDRKVAVSNMSFYSKNTQIEFNKMLYHYQQLHGIRAKITRLPAGVIKQFYASHLRAAKFLA